jgi:NAD(P)-dependent dehydrogenase (short-subunit alcohol dehydrogenase family)
MTELSGSHLDDALRAAAEAHPLGRIGMPEDVAELIAYLVSSRSSFVTGQTIVIDGGITTRFALAHQWESQIIQ